VRDSLLRKARTSQCHIDWDFYKETQTEIERTEAEKLLVDNQVMQNNHNRHAFVKLFGGTHQIDWRN
jgi:hypothetical protein